MVFLSLERREKLWTNNNVVFSFVVVMNLLIYSDRGFVPGAESAFSGFVKRSLDADKPGAYVGIIQSAFVIGVSVACVVFGHLLHHFKAQRLMGIGMTIFLIALIICAFSKVANSYGLLIFGRILSGVGEASYISVAPLILADNAGEKKSLWMSLYYAMIPLGIALGFCLSSLTAEASAIGGWSFNYFFLAVVLVIPTFLLTTLPDSLFPQGNRASEEVLAIDTENNFVVRSSVISNNGEKLSSPIHNRESLIISSSTTLKGTEAPLLGNEVNSPSTFSNSSVSVTNHHTAPSVLEELKFVFSSSGFLLASWAASAYCGVTMGYSVYGASINVGLGFFPVENRSLSAMTIGAITCITGVIGTLGGSLLCATEKDSTTIGRMEAMIKNALGSAHISVLACIFLYLCTLMTSAGPFFVFFALFLTCIFASQPPSNLSVIYSVPEANRSFALGVQTIILHAFGDFPFNPLVGAMLDGFAPNCRYDDTMTEDEIKAQMNVCEKDGRDGLYLTLQLLCIWCCWCFFSPYLSAYLNSSKLKKLKKDAETLIIDARNVTTADGLNLINFHDNTKHADNKTDDDSHLIISAPIHEYPTLGNYSGRLSVSGVARLTTTERESYMAHNRRVTSGRVNNIITSNNNSSSNTPPPASASAVPSSLTPPIVSMNKRSRTASPSSGNLLDAAADLAETRDSVKNSNEGTNIVALSQPQLEERDHKTNASSPEILTASSVPPATETLQEEEKHFDVSEHVVDTIENVNGEATYSLDKNDDNDNGSEQRENVTQGELEHEFIEEKNMYEVYEEEKDDEANHHNDSNVSQENINLTINTHANTVSDIENNDENHELNSSSPALEEKE